MFSPTLLVLDLGYPPLLNQELYPITLTKIFEKKKLKILKQVTHAISRTSKTTTVQGICRKKMNNVAGVILGQNLLFDVLPSSLSA